MSQLLESIIYKPSENSLKILNQLLLPQSVSYEDIKCTEDAWNAIKLMKIRGAPAIAILGLLSVAVELGQESIQESIDETDKLMKFLKEKADYLCTSRPTAVNIRKEFDQLVSLAGKQCKENANDLVKLTSTIKGYCFDALELDRRTNKKIGDNGAKIIKSNCTTGKKLKVLTHCNTGSLATAGYGTALGVVRSLNLQAVLQMAYCTETRPYNQGSRLTAWELVTDNIPGTLICDNMVASLMASRTIDAVVVGADRVVANGDTANKIGTYQIAILAKHFNVPFYVASPRSTLDLSIPDGSKIPIEERPQNEMKFIGNVQIAPANINCWNPSFDVTPAELITGIITEEGVFLPSELFKQFS